MKHRYRDEFASVLASSSLASNGNACIAGYTSRRDMAIVLKQRYVRLHIAGLSPDEHTRIVCDQTETIIQLYGN